MKQVLVTKLNSKTYRDSHLYFFQWHSWYWL